MVRSYDVVIIGGGIAGAFLARQLKLTRPGLAILVIEAQTRIDDYKVGESTVEVAASYMIRRLNLGTYLYQHQLPKNGLRFFFDAPEKDLPLSRMSEIGSDHMPFHPSFQLERAALERDLAVMNAEAGIDVELGARVVDFTVDGASRHTVVYEKGEDRERNEVSCRWLIDASGRRHLLHRKLGNPITKETRLNTGAGWARYRNVKGLDAIQDPAWRARVRYTSRHLSTNHLMYDGYWLWFIPLAGDLMSVGAVFDKDRVKGPRNQEEFETFMRSHRCARDLLEGASLEDYQQYAHLPYHSDVFFSKDRWAVTGFAGAFADPFYSPGSDFIAVANEFITSLICAELDGDPGLPDRIETYNAYYRFKYESVIRLYIKMYPIFGSFEVFRLKYLLDFNNYYNLVVWPFMADKLTDLGWLKEELAVSGRVLQAISTMGDHFAAMAEDLRARGEYYGQNEGRWANALCGVAHLQERLGATFDPAFRRAEVDNAFGSVFAEVLERRAGVPGLAGRERVQSHLTLPDVLVFTEINEESVSRFLERVGRSIARDLGREFPGVGKITVRLAPTPGVGCQIEVSGPAEADLGPIRARAAALWDAPSASLAKVVL